MAKKVSSDWARMQYKISQARLHLWLNHGQELSSHQELAIKNEYMKELKKKQS